VSNESNLHVCAQEYYQAFNDGYMLFLTENYHSQTFRLFMEFDFDWEVPGACSSWHPVAIKTCIKLWP